MPLRNSPAFARILLVALVFSVSSGHCAELPERFGSVYRINGLIAVVEGTSGSVRDLKPGDVLNVGDQVRATPNGEAILRTDDAGFIAVRPNSVFTMERFVAKGNDDDRLTLRIFSGALRLITGWIGTRKKERYQIVTATATIGIRGTDHEPYVLSTELSSEHQQPEGTYDKVNKGGVILTAAGAQVSINPGQVGFAPSLPRDRTRSLMTVLMPVLLERVPSFFVAGRFDAELDQLASSNLRETPGMTGSNSLPSTTPTGQATENKSAPQALEAQTTNFSAVPQDALPHSTSPGKTVGPSPCRPTETAAAWLEQLDLAVRNRDPQSYVNMFAQQAKVTAQVRDADGKYTEFVFSRNELAKSTFASLNRLSQYESRRIAVKATPGANSTPARCNKVTIESIVVEGGIRDGQSYQIESTEKFTIESKPGGWLAIEASTRQR